MSAGELRRRPVLFGVGRAIAVAFVSPMMLSQCSSDDESSSSATPSVQSEGVAPSEVAPERSPTTSLGVVSDDSLKRRVECNDVRRQDNVGGCGEERRDESRDERERMAAPEIDVTAGSKGIAVLIAGLLLAEEGLRRRR